jgi:hypoxanthine phosphoribosyltransferase
MLDYRKKKLSQLPLRYQSSDLEGVLIGQDEIQEQIAKLATELKMTKWHCIIVLSGAVFFAADLMRQIECTYDTIQVSSYKGTESTRNPRISKPLTKPIKGRDILIIEDIIDTGHTVKFLVGYCKKAGAKSVKVAALLSKPARREVRIRVDYLGFLVPNKFLVGYGLDWGEKYRTLPFIAVVKT